MKNFTTIFKQILNNIPYQTFQSIVNHQNADKYVKYFTCIRQMTVLLYSIISQKDSLRDILTGLATKQNKLSHLGLSKICRSTLSDANKRIPYNIYESLFYHILNKCRDLSGKRRFKFKNPLFSIDSTLIDLCLSIFPWAKFRKKKGAIKLHFKYDHQGEIPDFIVITDGKKHDAKMACHFPIMSDSIYVVDRGYVDFAWLNSIDSQKAYFVTRAKSNMNYHVIGQHKPITSKNVISDKIIELSGQRSYSLYPKKMRIIEYHDPETKKTFSFITNNFELAAGTIAKIYKSRWEIELFFKWIKQNLKIKSFLGTSQNAVMTQIWLAMCYFLILRYIKYQTRYRYSLLELSRVIRETLFDNANLIDILNINIESVGKIKNRDYQNVFL